MGEAERVIPQRSMIERARVVCQADERVVAGLMYGSFTRGEGDEHSDIEFALFFEEDVLPQLDQRAWLAQIAPVLAYFGDSHGHHTALFAGLIRGEFHFKPASPRRPPSRGMLSGAATPGCPRPRKRCWSTGPERCAKRSRRWSVRRLYKVNLTTQVLRSA